MSPDEALEEFRSVSGFGDALEALAGQSAALARRCGPRRRRIPPRPSSAGGGASQDAGVDIVEVDTAWVRRLHAIEDHAAARAAGGRGSRRRRARGRRQHDPAGDQKPPRRDRGHEARRRQQRLRAPAVPLLRASGRAWAAACSRPVSSPLGLMVLEPSWRGSPPPTARRSSCGTLDPRNGRWSSASGAALGFLGAWLAAAWHLRRIEPRA